jgi:hypothetical protein
MDVDLLQHLRSRRTLRSTTERTDLVTCSICLRVRRGSEWRAAEQVIRELRSYEFEAPPRLHSAVCEVCAESIFSRRVAEEIRVEAA